MDWVNTYLECDIRESGCLQRFVTDLDERVPDTGHSSVGRTRLTRARRRGCPCLRADLLWVSSSEYALPVCEAVWEDNDYTV